MTQLTDMEDELRTLAKTHGSMAKILRARPDLSREFLLRADAKYSLGLLARVGTGRPLPGRACPKPGPKKKGVE